MTNFDNKQEMKIEVERLEYVAAAVGHLVVMFVAFSRNVRCI